MHSHAWRKAPPPQQVRQGVRRVEEVRRGHEHHPRVVQQVYHRPQTTCCTPLCMIVTVIIVLLLLGGIIGLIVYFVLPRVETPTEPPVIDCERGYERVAYNTGGATKCTDIDECDQYPSMCRSGSYCRNMPGTYECLPCASGLVSSTDGRTCIRAPVPTPDPDPCRATPNVCTWKSYSQCFSIGTAPGYTCLCMPGYTERNGQCQTQTGTPAPDNACKPGVCNWKPNSVCYVNAYDVGYTCYCAVGYVEYYGICQLPTPAPTELANPCLDSTTCSADTNTLCYLIDGSGAYHCLCRPGYDKVDGVCRASAHCYSRICLNGGACVRQNFQDTCQCPVGYSGDVCEIASPCVSNPCWHGVCSAAYDGFFCECLDGWRGDLCDTRVTECDVLPCINGWCKGAFEGYVCECDKGYEGQRCDVLSNDCAAGHCQPDNSICIDGVSTFTCVCLAGWEGDWCDTSINDCLSSGCNAPHSLCVDGHRSFECVCDFGWTGTLCETEIIPICDVTINPEAWTLGTTTQCLLGFNTAIVTVAAGDITACQAACEADTTIASGCCSVEYNPTDGTCHLSEANHFSQAAAITGCGAPFLYSESTCDTVCPGVITA